MAEANLQEQAKQATSQTNGTASSTPPTSNGTAAPIPGWTAQLPPELRTPEVLRHKTFAEYVKDSAEYRKSAILVPGEHATDEQRAEYYAKLGRPESADKYDIKLPDGAPLDEKLVGSFKGVAHQLGLSNEAAQKLTEWYAGQASGIMDQNGARMEQQKAEWHAELEKEWGWQTERNSKLAAMTLTRELGGNADHPFIKYLNETGMGNHPGFIKYFYELGKKSGEDKFLQPDTGPSDEARGDAQTQIRELRADPDYHNSQSPRYRNLRERSRVLYDILKAKAPE